MEILKVIGIAVLGIVILNIVRQGKSEFALLTSIALIVLLLSVVFTPLKNLLESINNFTSRFSNGGVYFTTAIKVVGIAYLTSFASDLARDSSEVALANKVELAGKILIMSVALPILLGLLDTLLKMLG